MGRRWVLRAVTSLAVIVTSGCVLKTDLVAGAFNHGALDSVGDPFRVASDLAASRVERIVEQEVTDGYFRQGCDGEAAQWLAAAANDVGDFVAIIDTLNTPAPRPGKRASRGERATIAKARTAKSVASWITTPPAPICSATNAVDSRALEVFLDGVRFQEAVWRAARRIAAIRVEGLVESNDVARGAKLAFERAAAYVKRRHWRRRENEKNVALAVEGGAAQGIFAAGAVWTVLNLINGWMGECHAGDPACAAKHDARFRLVSGTSTGAMISVAVDRFNSMLTTAGRDQEINNIAKWFTCYSFSDLMCGQSSSIFGLFDTTPSALRGVLRFDGIQKMLTSCVKPWMFDNVSELILNTTEFRSGRIFALSDQNELRQRDDVVHAALASALLPLIGDPDRDVWDGVQFDPKFDPNDRARTEPVYLDGGIRSELPVLPLVRRGAERVLAIGSGASTVTEVGQLQNALGIAARYININTGSVLETELEYAQRLAESMRQDEIDACTSALEADPARCDVSKGCNPWEVCHGGFASVCDLPSITDETWRIQEDRERRTFAGLTLQQRLQPFWQLESIFMDQANVDGLAGYDFNPSDLRRLFRAGAEAARMRCPDIAHLLGILPPTRAASKTELENINAWCSTRMPPRDAICGPQTSAPGGFVLRSCTTPPPDVLDACATLPPNPR